MGSEGATLGDMSDGTDLPESWGTDESGSSSNRWLKWVGGAVVLALLVVGGVIAAQKISKKTEKAWPAVLGGPPGGFVSTGAKANDPAPGAVPGGYLWNDFQGWHLWIVHGGGVAKVQGTLTSDKDFAKAELAVGGVGSLRSEGNKVTFSLPASGKVAAIDFGPGFYAKKIGLQLDADIPVFEGGTKKRVKLPVVIEKLDASDPAAAK
jgi:hypothetical protein